jgi:hypothetical protein
MQEADVELRPWIWEDQRQKKEDWPTITNNRGTVIPIPPRRYVVKVMSDHPVTVSPYRRNLMLENLKPIITHIHNYKRARESLNSLNSYFQIMESEKGKYLYLQLTNISSQIIRRELFNHVLAMLEAETYRPTTTWIQQEHQNNPYSIFRTQTTEEVLTVITQAQVKLEAYKIWEDVQAPWTYRQRIRLTHLCHNRSQAVLLARMVQREISQVRKDERKKGIMAKLFGKRKRQTTETTTNDQDRQEPETTAHILPSSSTKTTSGKDGRPPSRQEEKQARVSSPSITIKDRHLLCKFENFTKKTKSLKSMRRIREEQGHDRIPD